ncbi:hypothetical protein H4W80_001167 [Nonomuraea angiospora]|uniref:Uncharacterized protein n=1 Tax=Nonomuraea angiospora TaxID=46172 RepID=A0ABR9LQH5_9ACTN|nr:hypothetical protein [Nonomuraea angiospora]
MIPAATVAPDKPGQGGAPVALVVRVVGSARAGTTRCRDGMRLKTRAGWEKLSAAAH